jgi:hypothetical protein
VANGNNVRRFSGALIALLDYPPQAIVLFLRRFLLCRARKATECGSRNDLSCELQSDFCSSGAAPPDLVQLERTGDTRPEILDRISRRF